MGFQLPRVSKCCCCVPLRIGTLLIGYISIIMSLFSIAASSFSIYAVSEFVKTYKNDTDLVHRPEDAQQTAIGLYLTFSFYLVIFTFNIVISVMLLYGAHSKQPKYLKYYYSATIFVFCMSIALVVLTCVFMGIFPTLGVLKWSLTLLMIIVIVRSAYLEMVEEQKQPLPYELQPYNYGQQGSPLMA